MTRASFAITLLFMSACSRAPQDATPEGVVKLWLERMEASTDDPHAAHDAFLLLGPRARANLEERATRASKMQGRQETAEQMLAQGRFGLKFRPKSMTTVIHGTDAIVDVVGSDAVNEHAAVQCDQENGAWRIEPDLPEIAQLRRQTDGTRDDGSRDGGS
ncbi:MAG: hypothetical protein ABI183_04965 [Polyangiaceae bacterium]